MTPVRLEPAALRSRVKHSTTEPLRSLYYIAYDVRISCKGPLSAALYVYCCLENQFYVFQTAPVVVYPSDVSIEYVIAPVSLTESVFM